MMRNTISQIEQRLRAKDYKMTSQREQILKIFLENQDKHLSAEDILYLVKKRSPEIGLATIYRTLDLFLEMDVIHSIDFGDGRKRYEFGFFSNDEQQHHHHHLICLQCGKIIEVVEDLLEDLEERITKSENFKVTNHQLKVYGYCQDCQK